MYFSLPVAGFTHIEKRVKYGISHYGLYHLNYAKLISARWSQLLGREDVFDFRKFLG